MWPLYLIGLVAYISANPPGNYLSYILRQLGFSTFQVRDNGHGTCTDRLLLTTHRLHRQIF